jgi:lysophospholipase L1-like esterase
MSIACCWYRCSTRLAWMAVLAIGVCPAKSAETGAVSGATVESTAIVADPCALISAVAPSERVARDWPNLCKYRSANAALSEPTRVVFMGDSITEGWASSDPALFSHGVVGRGISGQTTPQMVVRFYNDVILLHPTVVHILAGTNDVAGNTGPTTIQDYKNNIGAMVDMAKAHHIRVVLASIPPAATFPWKPAYRPSPIITSLNSWLRQFSRAQKIGYVDYYAILVDSDGGFRKELSGDGVHPNHDGYAVMRSMAIRAIR